MIEMPVSQGPTPEGFEEVYAGWENANLSNSGPRAMSVIRSKSTPYVPQVRGFIKETGDLQYHLHPWSLRPSVKGLGRLGCHQISGYLSATRIATNRLSNG